MIRARLPNPDLRLRPGMLMTVSIEASPRDRLGVPELAVVSEGETRYVFVIGADGKVARTAVKTGTRQNGLVEVTDGLRRGQRVVGDGVEIGRAHVCTPVTNAQLVCRILLEK